MELPSPRRTSSRTVPRPTRSSPPLSSKSSTSSAASPVTRRTGYRTQPTRGEPAPIDKPVAHWAQREPGELRNGGKGQVRPAALGQEAIARVQDPAVIADRALLSMDGVSSRAGTAHLGCPGSARGSGCTACTSMRTGRLSSTGRRCNAIGWRPVRNRPAVAGHERPRAAIGHGVPEPGVGRLNRLQGLRRGLGLPHDWHSE